MVDTAWLILFWFLRIWRINIEKRLKIFFSKWNIRITIPFWSWFHFFPYFIQYRTIISNLFLRNVHLLCKSWRSMSEEFLNSFHIDIAVFQSWSINMSQVMPMKIGKLACSQKTMKMFPQMGTGNWKPVFPTSDIIIVMKRNDFIPLFFIPCTFQDQFICNPVRQGYCTGRSSCLRFDFLSRHTFFISSFVLLPSCLLIYTISEVKSIS